MAYSKAAGVAVLAVLVHLTAPACAEDQNLCSADSPSPTRDSLLKRLAACKTAISANPKSVKPLVTAAALELRLQEYGAARDDYTAAIVLAPADSQIWAGRCDANYLLGDKVVAVSDCTKSIELNQQQARAFFSRGQLRVQLGDHAGAIDDLDHAIANADVRQPLFDYWHAKANYGLKLWSATIADITRYIAKVPDDPDAYRLRAASYINNGDNPHAVADLGQAATLYERQGDAQNAARMRTLVERFSQPSNQFAK